MGWQALQVDYHRGGNIIIDTLSGFVGLPGNYSVTPSLGSEVTPQSITLRFGLCKLESSS